MIIRQCIPADRAPAEAFLRNARGDATQEDPSSQAPFQLQLSLIATEGDATQGVALCWTCEGTTRELVVATIQAALVQTLIDKAVTKLHAQGIHKCRVKVVCGTQPAEVWTQSRWTGTSPEAETRPAGVPVEQ